MLAEEAGRRDIREQLAHMEGAFLGASAAWSKEGFVQFDQVRSRLQRALSHEPDEPGQD